MKVLGISPFHDSSVCVIEDGKILSFYKEERLSKKKRDNHPLLALKKIGEKHTNIDAAIICSPTNGDLSLFVYEKYLKDVLKIPIVIDLSHEHHLQHASLAFYNSSFKEALVFVIDRNGSFVGSGCRESESVFVASYPSNFSEIYKNYCLEDITKIKSSIEDLQKWYELIDHEVKIDISSTHGIVKVYESATTLIKQHVLENGKVMGLSAYGSYDSQHDNLFIENNIGNFNILSFKKNNYASVNPFLERYETDEVTEHNYKLYADYAYAVQQQTQNAALKLIEEYVTKTGITYVCITGGYALNVVSNAFYKKALPHVNFYFEPLADDSGNSIGGALLYYRDTTNTTNILPIKNTFFHGDHAPLPQGKGEKISISQVAQLLIENKSVALFYGLSEAGPRALGHRSILFDPRDKDAKNKTNEIKEREWYRPFAAAMLKEDAYKYFYVSDEVNSYNMTINALAKPIAKIEIPGILHVDDTCRIQIVTDEKEPLFKLLKEFKKETGVGVLLNTSFNLAGKPLVETPEEAEIVLNNSKLDFVWFPKEKKILGENK